MATVIFVHGISNKPEKDVLIRLWRNALATDHSDNDGIDLTTRVRIRSVHWADILYEAPLSQAQIAEAAEMSLESADALASGGPSLDGVDPAYLAALAEDLQFDPDELTDPQRIATTWGCPRTRFKNRESSSSLVNRITICPASRDFRACRGQCRMRASGATAFTG